MTVLQPQERRGGLGRRHKALGEESRRLKRVVAVQALNIKVLRDVSGGDDDRRVMGLPSLGAQANVTGVDAEGVLRRVIGDGDSP